MHDLPLLTTIAAGFAAAWVLGLVTQRLGLSPIVGYLLAGVAIGPYTPGFVGDVHAAHQLAELGVILLMFGVGLHFHLADLLAVRRVAIPGAVFQSLVATAVAAAIFALFGWPIRAGVVLGMAMAVASTVVLLRVLMDSSLLNTPHGHVAVGWLIVEDIFTVLLLVVVPLFGGSTADAAGGSGQLAAVGWALAKLALLVALVLLAGSRVIPWVLVQVAKLRSRELFTLTILVLSIAVAVGSASLFGASVALGAFLAGMVVGQSPVSQQAASDALPMRDAFAVLFFVSVGMLFDPSFLVQEPLMVAAALAVVMIAKPLAALVIVAVLGYPARTALTVAVGLAQIGEFSFILGQVALDHRLIPADGQHVLIAAAMISITANPLLFRLLPRLEAWAQRHPLVWSLLNGRAARRERAINEAARPAIEASSKPLALIVGYGPVGRVVDAILRDTGLETVIIDTNMDTVRSLADQRRAAIFGDAGRGDILEQAGIRRAAHLVLTATGLGNALPLVVAARELNPAIEVTVRARYLREREVLEQAGAAVVVEEAEVGIAVARRVMQQRGVDDATAERMARALRQLWLRDGGAGPQDAAPPG